MENDMTNRCACEIQAAIDAALASAEPGQSVVVELEPGLYLPCED